MTNNDRISQCITTSPLCNDQLEAIFSFIYGTFYHTAILQWQVYSVHSVDNNQELTRSLTLNDCNNQTLTTLAELINAPLNNTHQDNSFLLCFFQPDNPATKVNIYHSLVVGISYNQGQLTIDLIFDKCHHPRSILTEILTSFTYLVSNFDRLQDTVIANICIASPSQLQYYEQLNQPSESNNHHEPIHTYINRITNKYPHNLAIISVEQCITYEQLSYFSHCVSAHLIAKNIQLDKPIAILGTRSWRLIVVIIGILQAGGSYLPLNSNDPIRRNQKILQQARINDVIIEDDVKEWAMHVDSTLHNIKDLLTPCDIPFEMPIVDITSPAYIIFTSGSTGAPKGVQVSHSSVVNTLLDMIAKIKINANDRILALSSLSFDLSLFDIFAALLTGASCVLLDDADKANPQAWLHLIKHYQITIWNSVPVLLQLLLNYDATPNLMPSVRVILLSGDLIPSNLPVKIRDLFSHPPQVFSLGGSTEAAIWSIYYDISQWENSAPIPYGRPLTNQTIYILDANNNVLPPGAVGEIVIGGHGIAIGYYYAAKLSAQRFPTLPGMGRVFKTHDLGRLNTEENYIEIMGRIDHQVKIQGNRVDLTEIEQAILSITDKCQALAFPYSSLGLQKLAVIIQHNNTHVSPEKDIKNQLKHFLPAALVPHRILFCSQLPLNSNAKIDYTQLKNLVCEKNMRQLPDLKLAQKPCAQKPCAQQLHLSPQQLGFYTARAKHKNIHQLLTINLKYSFILELAAFEKAWTKTAHRYLALQQTIINDTGNICSETSSLVGSSIYFFDWRHKLSHQAEADFSLLNDKLYQQGLPPSAPALTIYIAYLSHNSSHVFLLFQHMWIDAVSASWLVDSFYYDYMMIDNPQVKLAAPFKDSYQAACLWRKQYDLVNEKEFWQQQLALIDEKTSLAAALPKLADNSSQLIYSISNIKLLPAQTDELDSLCLQHAVTPAIVLQALWSFLLAAVTSNSQIISGIVYSGRHNLPSSLHQTIGCMVNTLPLILTIDPHYSLKDWLQYVKEQMGQLKQFDLMSLLDLTGLLNDDITQYFDTLVTIHNFPQPRKDLVAGLTSFSCSQKNKFCITMQFNPDQLDIDLICNNKLLHPKQGQLIANTFTSILTHVLSSSPPILLKEINLVGHHYAAASSFRYGGSKNYDKYFLNCISHCFINHSSLIACSCENYTYSYRQLSYDVNRLLAKITEPQVCIAALKINRGYGYVVALLACLMAEVTFVPLAENWPATRVDAIIQQCSVDMIISVSPDKEPTQLTYKLESIKSMPKKTHNKLAYIFYTSGSSGIPKGVQVSRSALNNNLLSLQSTINFTDNDRWMSITETTFDIVLLEIMLPLMVGGTLLLPSKSILTNSHALSRYMLSVEPTFLQATPTRLSLWQAQHIPLQMLTCILCGGEYLSHSLMLKLQYKNTRLINLYGPTEATIWTTYADLTHADQTHIGIPIANSHCTVVNNFGQCLPLGVIGQLLIGGNGLADGYVTSEQVKPLFQLADNRHEGTGRVYYTGDQVWMDQDHIYYAGRIDRQIKIKGVRIDPIDIEHTIRATKLVDSAVVLSHPQTGNLTAFLTPRKSCQQQLKLSIFLFPEQNNSSHHYFSYYKKLATTAEQSGLYGIWIPERHFDEVGALFSSTSVMATYLASNTQRLKISAGSIVLPIHNLIRVLEAWSTIDVLSNGRIRLSMASGWHSDDFVFAPNNYATRKQVMLSAISSIKSGWESGKMSAVNGLGDPIQVSIYPQPLQKKCPLWITIAEDINLFIEAGRKGYNILTHLLFQNITELSTKITAYYDALQKNGYNPANFDITLMIHTYIHQQPGRAQEIVKDPLLTYFQAHLNLMLKIRKESATTQLPRAHLAAAVDEFIHSKGLFGSLDECNKKIKELQFHGITEVACLVDFGLSEQQVLATVQKISRLNTVTNLHKNTINLKRLTENISEKLVPQAVPTNYKIIDSIPYSKHGKIDYQSLHAIHQRDQVMIQEQGANLHHMTRIIDLWKSILQRDNIRTDLSFFQQGGHSLKAIDLLNRLENDLGITISLLDFFQQPTIDFIYESQQKQSPINDPTKQTKPDSINNWTVSSLQEALWSHLQIYPHASCYNDSFLLKLKVSISASELQRAIQAVVDNEVNYQLGFQANDRSLIRVPCKEKLIIPLKEYNRPLLKLADDKEVNSFIQNYMHSKFQYTTHPPIRIMIHQFSNTIYVHIVISHLVTDGTSLTILLKRIENQLATNQADQSVSHNTYVPPLNNTCDADQTINNYIRVHGLVNTVNNFHTNNKRIARTFIGFKRSLNISSSSASLSYLSTKYSVSIATVILAIYSKSLLASINEDQLQVGIPVSLRTHKESQAIGLYVNMGIISLSKQNSTHWNIKQWICQAKQSINLVLANRKVLYPHIVKHLKMSPSTTYNPLFQYVFNSFQHPINLNMFELENIDYKIARFDLELMFNEDSAPLTLDFIFSEDIFSNELANQFITKFTDNLQWFSRSQYALTSDDTHYVDYWRTIYNKLYSKTCNIEQQKWDGWNNSTTGLPLPIDAMEEWLQDIISKVSRIATGKLLDVGCGTCAIVPHIYSLIDSYVGIDLSDEIISKLTAFFAHDKKTIFRTMSAHDITEFEDGFFNTILCTSVCQYFPSHQYFYTFLATALQLSSTYQGTLFIGDVRCAEWNQPGVVTSFINSSDEIPVHNNPAELCISLHEVRSFLNFYPDILYLIEPKVIHADNELSNSRLDISVIHQAGVSNPFTPSIYNCPIEFNITKLVHLCRDHLLASNEPLIIQNISNHSFHHQSIRLINLKDQLQGVSLYCWFEVATDPTQFNCLVFNQPLSLLHIISCLQSLPKVDQHQPIKWKKQIANSNTLNNFFPKKLLKDIWCSILGDIKIKPYDNYFELGADSFMLVSLHAKLIDHGIEINISDLITAPRFLDQWILVNTHKIIDRSRC